MDIATVFGGDSLKAADLQGSEPTVIISHVQMKEFDDGNKLVVSFEGKKKSLVCNKTNANRIAFMYGSETNNWIGKPITLYEEMVDFQGKLTPAIRIRAERKAVPASQQMKVRPSSAEMGREPEMAGGAPPRGRDAMDDEIPFAPEWR